MADKQTIHATAIQIVHDEAGRTLSRDHFDLCMRIAKRALLSTANAQAAAPGDSPRPEDITLYANRYAYLRARPLDTIEKGGVFAGLTPQNVILSGADLDNECDAAIEAENFSPLAPGFHCPACNAPRKDRHCHKCREETIKPSAGWRYPALPPINLIRSLAREVGYAIGVHGTLERDLDLIAAPWTDEAVGNHALIEHIAQGLGARTIHTERKPLGRYAVTIQMDGWFKPIDLSVCPIAHHEVA